jgi:LAS superfamily LD-carboxypeptidase LdcB
LACWPSPEAESQQQGVQPAGGGQSREQRWPETLKADYAGVPVNDYLAGRFAPPAVPAFVVLEQAGVPTDGRVHYLRREAAAALKNMIADYCAAHPGAKIWVVSATRTYNDQKYIWEGKWNGGIPVNGQRLNQTIADPEARALEILKYSSMPGTSRHHWGTDVDLNNLTNEYFEQGRAGFCTNGWWLMPAATVSVNRTPPGDRPGITKRNGTGRICRCRFP